MGQKESLRIILKKIAVFVMWGYLLKKTDETGDVKRREGSGKPKVAELKITSMQSKS